MEGRAGTCGPMSMQVSITGVKQTSLGTKRDVCRVPHSHPKGPRLFSGSQEERRYLLGVERFPQRTAPTLASQQGGTEPKAGLFVVKALYCQR